MVLIKSNVIKYIYEEVFLIEMMNQKSQIIIFEGPDSSGKSTIARALSDNLGFPLIGSHGSSFFNGSSTQQNFAHQLMYGETARYEAIEKLSELMPLGLIIDRSFVTEYIYSEIYGRISHPAICYELDKKYARSFNTLVVVCVKDSYESLAQTQHPSIVEKHSQLDLAYRFWAVDADWEMNRLLLNTTDQDLDGQLTKIFRALTICK